MDGHGQCGVQCTAFGPVLADDARCNPRSFEPPVGLAEDLDPHATIPSVPRQVQCTPRPPVQ